MKKRKGFTLIEIILSIAIVGIISVSMLTIFNSGLMNIVRAGVRTEAVNKAEENFIENPIVISTETKRIVLPTMSKDNIDYVDIIGSNAKGIVIVNEGLTSQVEVEIEAFIPGLVGTDID